MIAGVLFRDYYVNKTEEDPVIAALLQVSIGILQQFINLAALFLYQCVGDGGDLPAALPG